MNDLIDLNFFLYNQIKELEWKWKHEPWQKWNERQWLEVFPEAKEIIPEKIKEWENIATDVYYKCRQRRDEIKGSTMDDFSKWFWLELSKWDEGKELNEALGHLDRLSWSLLDHKPQGSNFSRFTEALERAKTVDIMELAYKYLPKLRRSGKNYCACCVFHEEKTPSFFLYPETSTYHCFGCQAHGDVISLLMKLENIGFKEAVNRLGGI